jgi:aminomethyltransferase
VSAEPLRVTSLRAEHLAAGARMVPFAGWEMPVQYTGVVEEHVAVRTAAGLFDVSHMGEIEIEGADAGALVDALVTGDASRLADGRAMYTVACNERGTILDDLICYRRAADRWLVVCNASSRDKIVGHFTRERAARPALACALEDASDRTALVALQGPRALAIAAAAGADLADLASFGLREATLCGVGCLVARTGYTGEDGVELFCGWDDAPALWRGLLRAGASSGLRPAGLGARDTLRLEARLCLYGNDIDETTHPFEAGLGWVVKLDKAADFIGKGALAAAKGRPFERRLVGFEMAGRGIARHGYALLDADGRPVGRCTSGSPSPTLGKNIGLGYLPPDCAEPGTPIAVDCRGRVVEAKVIKTPFYKRAK